MSWWDALGRRRGDDEDYDTVQAELREERLAGIEPVVNCARCTLPIPKRFGITRHKICPETTSNQDGR